MNLIKDPNSDNPYLRAGFRDRKAYLRSLADSFGISLKRVKAAADMLGPDEDFDALLTILEDYYV